MPKINRNQPDRQTTESSTDSLPLYPHLVYLPGNRYKIVNLPEPGWWYSGKVGRWIKLDDITTRNRVSKC